MNVPAKTATPGEIIEELIIKGDLRKLSPEQRAKHYVQVCESLGLNPLTKPFDYLELGGKLILYPNRSAADQLRKINGISLAIVSQKINSDVLTVHVKAKDRDGREDEDWGAVPFPETLRGDARSNAILKAVTKAKRRVTLSISGLGWPDETEYETVPGARKVDEADIEDDLPEPTREAAETARHFFASKRAAEQDQAELENETDVVKQCAIRCADARFQTFLAETKTDGWKLLNTGTPTERAAELVRAIVGVKSRKDITPGSEAAEHWHDLEGRFQAWLRA